MNLTEALREVADYLGVNRKELDHHAHNLDVLAQDNWTRSDDKRGLIPFEADARFLMGLILTLRPKRVLESGTNDGGSTNVLAASMKLANPPGLPGKLVTVDVWQGSGQYVQRVLYPFVEVVHQDICDYVQRPDATHFNFIHEDASHEIHTVRAVYEALPKLMPDGGVIVSHDTATGVRDAILTGIRNAGFDEPPLLVEYDESPCGFSVMKYAGAK